MSTLDSVDAMVKRDKSQYMKHNVDLPDYSNEFSNQKDDNKDRLIQDYGLHMDRQPSRKAQNYHKKRSNDKKHHTVTNNRYKEKPSNFAKNDDAKLNEDDSKRSKAKHSKISNILDSGAVKSKNGSIPSSCSSNTKSRREIKRRQDSKTSKDSNDLSGRFKDKRNHYHDSETSKYGEDSKSQSISIKWKTESDLTDVSSMNKSSSSTTNTSMAKDKLPDYSSSIIEENESSPNVLTSSPYDISSNQDSISKANKIETKHGVHSKLSWLFAKRTTCLGEGDGSNFYSTTTNGYTSYTSSSHTTQTLQTTAASRGSGTDEACVVMESSEPISPSSDSHIEFSERIAITTNNLLMKNESLKRWISPSRVRLALQRKKRQDRQTQASLGYGRAVTELLNYRKSVDELSDAEEKIRQERKESGEKIEMLNERLDGVSKLGATWDEKFRQRRQTRDEIIMELKERQKAFDILRDSIMLKQLQNESLNRDIQNQKKEINQISAGHNEMERNLADTSDNLDKLEWQNASLREYNCELKKKTEELDIIAALLMRDIDTNKSEIRRFKSLFGDINKKHKEADETFAKESNSALKDVANLKEYGNGMTAKMLKSIITGSEKTVDPRNLRRWFNSQIRALESKAVELDVYNGELGKSLAKSRQQSRDLVQRVQYVRSDVPAACQLLPSSVWARYRYMTHNSDLLDVYPISDEEDIPDQDVLADGLAGLDLRSAPTVKSKSDHAADDDDEEEIWRDVLEPDVCSEQGLGSSSKNTT